MGVILGCMGGAAGWGKPPRVGTDVTVPAPGAAMNRIPLTSRDDDCDTRSAGRIARKGTRMKQIVLIVIGGLLALTGIVWTLQGLGYISGSFMTGATLWAVIGPVVLVAGLVIIALGLRARRRVR
jgi:hypothetical protein